MEGGSNGEKVKTRTLENHKGAAPGIGRRGLQMEGVAGRDGEKKDGEIPLCAGRPIRRKRMGEEKVGLLRSE